MATITIDSSLEEFQEMEQTSGLVRVMPKIDYDIKNLFTNLENEHDSEFVMADSMCKFKNFRVQNK